MNTPQDPRLAALLILFATAFIAGTTLLAKVLRPPWRFFYMYVVRRGFLDGRAGFMLARLGAHFTFMKYARLGELVRADRAGRTS